jgi:hypothetical protein
LAYGFFAQDAYTVIPDRLRISGAVRYSVASYNARAADSAPTPNGKPLFPDDSARFDAFSGRIGAVLQLGKGFDLAGKYTHGFRAPNTTDLGLLGLVGTGFEVDATTAASRGGFIGTTAGGDAVSSGIPVTKLGPENSDSFDFSLRYKSSRLSFDITGFTNKLSDVYFDQALVLPPEQQEPSGQRTDYCAERQRSGLCCCCSNQSSARQSQLRSGSFSTASSLTAECVLMKSSALPVMRLTSALTAFRMVYLLTLKEACQTQRPSLVSDINHGRAFTSKPTQPLPVDKDVCPL